VFKSRISYLDPAEHIEDIDRDQSAGSPLIGVGSAWSALACVPCRREGVIFRYSAHSDRVSKRRSASKEFEVSLSGRPIFSIPVSIAGLSLDQFIGLSTQQSTHAESFTSRVRTGDCHAQRAGRVARYSRITACRRHEGRSQDVRHEISSCRQIRMVRRARLRIRCGRLNNGFLPAE
jgi:hypothetical protein